ncbi:MAG: FAD-binding oxidoreductase [Phaeovulum sp.]|uniref:NAD(P)/FAD-dependent oxidoreductase n=1 Tax=Phaeovulum sp. TaxID=2934796 RepID=UPI002732E2A4|nr:FAD-binding oxidoreductase [Phaeovulum sp.]MDP3860222.1 FAD-binding oxidoreductase [Phaeovulum sp.]
MNLLTVNDRPGRHPPSWYAETATPLPEFPALAGPVAADVCIIGAGYTGLSAALHLAERGLRVVVLEAHRAGFGASGRNGGQVGSGQRLEQGELERMLGREMARRLWDVGQDAKALVQELIARHAIACDYAPGIVHACRSPGEVAHAHANAEKLAQAYGYDKITPLDRAALAEILPSRAYCGGDLDLGAGHLHPLNFALGLARAASAAGAQIFEQSAVVEITPGTRPGARTSAGEVVADHLILACNGYLGNLAPRVAAHVMPINNFIVATEPLGARVAEVLRRNVAVADTRFVVNYWHLSPDQRLLFGGGESYGYRFPDLVKTVRKPMLEVYPGLADVAITHAWGGTLAITMNRLPHFARPAPGVLSASGYSGHGVALATLAGRMLAEAVAGDAAGFDLMASLPQPRFPGGAALRWPILVAAMTWFSMRDRLGI